MQTIKQLTIDLNKDVFQSIEAKQNDVNSRYLEITLIDNGIVCNLTNNTVKIYINKPDGTVIFNNATIEDSANGLVKIELTSQALAVVGQLNCELCIYGTDNSLLTSKVFTINVLACVHNDSAVQSTNEYTALTGALSTVNSYDSRITQNSSKIGVLIDNGITETDLSTAIKNDRASLADIPNQTYITEKAKTADVNALLTGKANVLTEIQQAFEIRNIKNAVEIDETSNLVAHVSNIAFSKNGKAYCIYLCDKVNKIENANNQQTEIWLSIYNIADPTNKTYKKICGVGTAVQWFTVETYAPYNPNIVYNKDTNEIFVFVFAHFIQDGTSTDAWSYLMFKINADTDEFVIATDGSNKIATFGLNITYNSTSYQINNVGIKDLLTALGYPNDTPYMQMTCNFVYKVVGGYGYYYTILGGINFKQIIIRTINFKNYEYVAIIDDGVNIKTPEASLQFISDTKMIILYRSDDTSTRALYYATYDINTHIFEFKGKYSNSASKPLIIKDYNNNIYAIYNVPWSKNAIFERRGINIDLYDIESNAFKNIYHNEYPYNIHYFAYALYNTEIYLTFTSGKKFVTFGNDYDSIQMITFGS